MRKLRVWVSFCILAAAMLVVAGNVSSQEGFDWQSDWAVVKGFAITPDSEGFDLPTAIAFVPDPGDDPDDPLYFVTELRGALKVVTNDRSVHTFAEDFFQLEPAHELPGFDAEVGLAGICLEPQRGYVFVTFAYQDENNILRNNIMRFETTPGSFGVRPDSQIAFTEVFAPYESSPSHQIGPCQVEDDLLYVSVGDGNVPVNSQNTASLLGKILRMTLDGEPVPDNPFYVDNDVGNAANYVWASGLRNPFSLRVVEGRVFVADNGPAVDRFLEIQAGENYQWDGSNWSIGARATALFAPSIGPVQLDIYQGGLSNFLPDYEGHLF